MSVDPLVEKTMQPYSAFNNNPIRYNDPTGMIAEEGDPGKKSWLSRAWGEVKSWFSDKPKMKVNIEVGEGTWSYFEETLEMVASTKIEVKATLGLQASLEGEVLNRKAGADVNVASLTIAKGSYEQQQSDYGPQKFDGFLFYSENDKGQNYVEVNQSLSGGLGLVSGGVSREFKGKSNSYEDLKDEKSVAVGPMSTSITHNEKGQVTDKKVNVARGKIALGFGIEIKLSTGYTTDKIKK
ncbi:hypothetical protein [Flavobacterium covae]